MSLVPTTDGIELLKQIRAASDVPVIMLTALGNEADRVLGLRMGADDYVVEPFSAGGTDGAHQLSAAAGPPGANGVEPVRRHATDRPRAPPVKRT